MDQNVGEVVMFNIKEISKMNKSNTIQLQGKPLILVRISDIKLWEVIIITCIDVFY